MSRALLVALILACVGSAIAVIYARYSHRQLFVQLSRLERERDELNIEYGRLQLEIATLVDAERIAQRARDELGMRVPGPADIVVITP